MFEPCFFDRNRLFGFYHPATESGSERLLVICPPLFDEYRRSYKALSELAKGCAAAGSHVFRFDYFGTGESWGDLEEVTVQTWIGDIQAAIDEGLALSGASQVYLLGVRFGATLAAQVRRPEIAGYIFWDLVPTGRDYLAHLARVDDLMAKLHGNILRHSKTKEGSISYEMFPLTRGQREEIAQVQTDIPTLATKARVHRIVCQEVHAIDGAEYGGFAYDWPIEHPGLLLPKPVLEAIARKLA
jgi:pimeloyl-ACP methyl ester carboxylesterase